MKDTFHQQEKQPMNRNLFIASFAALTLGLAGTGYADTLSGKVSSVDQGGNAITLSSPTNNAGENKEHKLVWDDSLAESQQLENAQIGQTLTVDAEQNAISRNWKVNSVRGPLSAVEKAISTDSRTLSGEVVEFDLAGRSLLLRSKESDDKGQPMQYRVVWDATNSNVHEKLQKAKIGDNLTVTADQNMITKNWKANSITGAIAAMVQGDVHTVAGEVKQVDRDKNFIVLSTIDASSGKTAEKKITWDDDFKQQAKLENAKIGERLSVRADQNMVTRTWKVTALS
jgi:TusA-related sulfurtransferase